MHNNNTLDIPFHARHEDELLTLDEVAQILMTSEHRPLVAPDWHRPRLLQDRPPALHDRRRPAPLHPRSADRLPASPPRTEVALIDMDSIHEDSPLDPRHVFLDATDVMHRYGWGKTKGYQNLKNRELVPAPVMTHPDRWRLDQLLAWEERRMEMAEAAPAALVSPGREELTITDLLPQPKRRRRRSASQPDGDTASKVNGMTTGVERG